MRFSGSVISVSFEEVAEEGKLDVLAVVIGSFCVEVDIAELVTIFTPPIAMSPGTHYEHIGDARILPFGPAIGFQGTEKVFLIVPAADGHYGAVNVLEMRTDVARLPVGIISGMLQKLCPFGRTAFHEHGIRIGEWAHAQKKLVTVRRSIREWLRVLVQRVFALLGKGIEEAEILA